MVSVGPLTDLTSIADVICGQQNVGCVVTAEGGESGICAFGSIVNMKQHKENIGIVALQTLLKDIVKKNGRSSKIVSRLVSSPDNVTGLLLKERLINFPPELAPNIHRVLIDDVKWSVSDEFEPDAGESRDDYKFTHILFLSTFEVEGGRESSGPLPVHPDQQTVKEAANPPPPIANMKQKRKQDKASAKAARIYHHWEDEMFLERAGFEHTWQNAGKPVVHRAGRKYQSFSILYGLEWEDYVELVDTLPTTL